MISESRPLQSLKTELPNQRVWRLQRVIEKPEVPVEVSPVLVAPKNRKHLRKV